jgi:hypothetical protein
MNPLFGRKWKITILLADGTTGLVVSDSDFGENALKCTFEIQKHTWEAYWFGLITIYNFTGPTLNMVITQGMKVIVEAGYKDGLYGKIYEGSVFQPMFDREDVVNYKTTLSCMDGLGLFDGNLINVTLQSGYDYSELIATMAKNARTPIPIGQTMEFQAKKMPRGKTVFGDPKKYLRQVSADNNAQFYIGDGKMNILNVNDESDLNANDAIILTPETGLIGTPQQTQDGIVFRCFLDSRIGIQKPLTMVKIDNAVIRQVKQSVGQYITPLDQDGYYKVIGIRHIGDTRGNDWYTECTAVNRSGKVSAMSLLDQSAR